jgi:hypothetical protein
MPSLVEELQRDALNTNISVTELLQKCLVVATKLGIDEFASWARLELDGYKGQEVPEYRVIYGEPQVFNPYRGYQPLRFGDHRFAEIVSKMQCNQPIGGIEYDLRQADKTGPGIFQMSFGPANEKLLMDAMEIPMQPSLRVTESQLRNIIDAVRKIVLEWSLKLESDGILGEGMSFSRKEKEKAQSVTYHIKNYIQGNIQHSQIQVESIDSSQEGSFREFDLFEVKEIIRALKASLNELGIEVDTKAELVSEIRTLESQTDSPKPKTSILRESLTSVRKILEGAAGNLAASGLLSQIGNLFGP